MKWTPLVSESNWICSSIRCVNSSSSCFKISEIFQTIIDISTHTHKHTLKQKERKRDILIHIYGAHIQCKIFIYVYSYHLWHSSSFLTYARKCCWDHIKFNRTTTGLIKFTYSLQIRGVRYSIQRNRQIHIVIYYIVVRRTRLT